MAPPHAPAGHGPPASGAPASDRTAFPARAPDGGRAGCFWT